MTSAPFALLPALQKIIRKRTPAEIREEALTLQQEIEQQKEALDKPLQGVTVTISYDDGKHHLKKTYWDCVLPLEHRQLIDQLLTGWSTIGFIKALIKQLTKHQAITKRPK
jgi:hypothetical protein